MSSSIVNIRKQLHGNAKHMPDSFNRHFLDFDESGKDYMVLTQWRQGVSGIRHVDSKFYPSLDEANASFLKLIENREIQEVYIFHWELGIELIKTGFSHRADLFEQSISK